MFMSCSFEEIPAPAGRGGGYTTPWRSKSGSKLTITGKFWGGDDGNVTSVDGHIRIAGYFDDQRTPPAGTLVYPVPGLRF